MRKRTKIETGIQLLSSGSYQVRLDRLGNTYSRTFPTLQEAKDFRNSLVAKMPAGKPTGLKAGTNIVCEVEPVKYDYRLILKRFNFTPEQKAQMLKVLTFLTKHKGKAYTIDYLVKELRMKEDVITFCLKTLLHLSGVVHTKNGYKVEKEEE